MSHSIPIYFLVGGVTEKELRRYETIEVDRDQSVFVLGRLNWIVQTFLVLRAQNVDVHLSRFLRHDGVNIGHADTLAERWDPAFFTVGVLADKLKFGSKPDLTIVQNRTQADPSDGRHWMPHWPQPGLQRRDERRTEVRVAAYVGGFFNLGMAPHLFAESCRRCGLEARLYGRHRGDDLSNVDVLVGVRSLDTQTHDNKPASKLVNAWLANIPFIGGYDSAFSQSGVPGCDYLRVSSQAELEEALTRLKNDPALYARLTEAGRRLGAAFDRTAVTRAWMAFLNEIVYPAHARHARKISSLSV